MVVVMVVDMGNVVVVMVHNCRISSHLNLCHGTIGWIPFLDRDVDVLDGGDGRH